VVVIKWESARIFSSKFPDPLITVDYALDDRPIGVELVGSKAEQAIEAFRYMAGAKVYQLALEFALDAVAARPEIKDLQSYTRLVEEIHRVRPHDQDQ
jgi:hypothetical protein